MTSKPSRENTRNSCAGRTFIFHSSHGVCPPQSVDGHRVTRLQAKTVRPTQHRRRRRWPRKKYMIKGRGVRKMKMGSKILPDLLGQRARKNEMASRLQYIWTMWTESVLRSKVFDTSAKRQDVHEQFIPGLTMDWESWRPPNSSPDILWRSTKTRYGATVPIQGCWYLCLFVQKTMCNCSS